MDEMGREHPELASMNEVLMKKMRGQIQSRESSKSMADLLGAYRREQEREKATMECLAREGG